MKKTLLLITLCLTFQAFGAEYFSDRGSMWLGSGLSYFNMKIDSATDRATYTSISPFIRYFFIRYLALGPRFEWIGESIGKTNERKIGAGLDLAAVYSYRPTTFYVSFGTAFNRYALHISRPLPLGNIDTAITGSSLSLNAGLIFTLKDIASLQLEPGYDIVTIKNVSGANANVFRFSIGICGIGKSTAVSILQVFPSPFWMF
jgi:hypothetical protein